MDKMVSPNGVKANMCCASCLYFGRIVLAGLCAKKWCKKKNRPISDYGQKCGYYVMDKFFQERGYKMIKD